ncbi:MAG: hypothetical protein EPN93_01010 [Spirochaetes bacterium]|nr:MAG: hypothetical protein EPN93_01010 [Spirochaetota bacterium]
MNKYGIIVAAFIVLLTASGLFSRDVLIDRGFRDDNTFFVVCKGYPNAALKNETERYESAKEAALTNAQVLSQEFLDVSVDVIRNGIVEDYQSANDYVVITYVIQLEGVISGRR